MAIYAAHCAPEAQRTPEALERTRLYRVGFVWPALLFGPLWLLAKRLWLTLLMWIVAAALVGAAIAAGWLDPAAGFWLYVLAAIFLGLEGRSLEAAALTRRGRPLADIVCARDSSAAERAFFFRATSTETPRPPPLPRHGGPPGPPPPVIGLFPEAGGSS